MPDKNRQIAGTFGRHVARFDLVYSGRSRKVRSANENPDDVSRPLAALALE
jgi:hypothetical protein